MRQWIESIFDTSRYASQIEKDRARLIYVMNSVVLIVATTFILYTISGAEPWEGNSIDASVFPFLFILFYATIVLSWTATRLGKLHLGGLLLVVTLIVTFGGLTIGSGSYTMPDGLFIAVMVVSAALLLPNWGLIVGLVAAAGILTLGIAQRATIPPIAVDSTYDFFASLLIIIVIGSLIFQFLRLARISRREGAADIQRERLNLAHITSQISQRIFRRVPVVEVLNGAVELVKTNLPAVYHAQIFLIDSDNKTARLVASSGEVGRLLLARGHSLSVGSLSVIGKVTSQNEAIIAYPDADDTIHRRNEFLPDTAVEAAFPLRLGDRVIGALDLQSKIKDTFAEDEFPIFQSLADHLAIAIDNARLFEETERRLQENQLLIDQGHEAIKEVERLNQQLTQKAWGEYMSSQGKVMGLDINLVETQVKPDTTWTRSIEQAIQQNNIVREKENGAQVVAIPLRVRGQVIGAMEFEVEENTLLSAEDMGLIEEVGEQLGLAAETNRLFETSQRLAQREALVNEIATRLQTTSSVDMTLTTAAQSLREALKASKVSIRLGSPGLSDNERGDHP